MKNARQYEAVTVAGLGLIGGSLALALRQSGFKGKIIGVSREASLRDARDLRAIDEGYPYEELPRAAAVSDLVVLATPISVIIDHLRTLGRHAEQLRPGSVITDVGSTKREILRTARESLPKHVTFIGGHPLAGSERRGLQAADPFLFQNAFYVLTPAPGAPEADADALGELLRSTGARIVVLSAEEHDRIAATISHLPQLLAVSLVRFLDDLGPNREAGLRLAAGGFRDMTRIASSPYSVWRDVIATNRDLIADVGGRFLEAAQAALGGLSDHSISEHFEQASRTRGEIPRDTKGFLHRLHDVLVVVEDRPGTIASVAGPLAKRGININDIEVLKVREGEGGTLRLGFGSAKHAREAVEMLEKIGYKARLRD